MIIVNLRGRLGNQMFCYALYKSLQALGKEVYLDLGCNRESGKQPEIVSAIEYNIGIFPIQYQLADAQNVEEMLRDKENRDIVRRWKYRIFPKQCLYYEEKQTGLYNPIVFRFNHVYLDGYWQSEKYFRNIRIEMKNIYQFPDIYSDYQKSILEQINKQNAVSVHIRRGDYLRHTDIYGCTDLNYYEKAMNYIRERVENSHFYIFTNDIPWVEKHFRGADITILKESQDLKTGNMDMSLMSKCRHNIIANSSFSWWGAWLNLNPNKIVIAPQVWEVGKKTPDVWCSNWIKM